MTEADQSNHGRLCDGSSDQALTLRCQFLTSAPMMIIGRFLGSSDESSFTRTAIPVELMLSHVISRFAEEDVGVKKIIHSFYSEV